MCHHCIVLLYLKKRERARVNFYGREFDKLNQKKIVTYNNAFPTQTIFNNKIVSCILSCYCCSYKIALLYEIRDFCMLGSCRITLSKYFEQPSCVSWCRACRRLHFTKHDVCFQGYPRVICGIEGMQFQLSRQARGRFTCFLFRCRTLMAVLV